MLRLIRPRDFFPPAHTVFVWTVDDIKQTVYALAAQGVQFLGTATSKPDMRGIWAAPDTSRIAWFQDPDGNTLSISRHPE